MCGACGSGVAVAPWETEVLGTGSPARKLIAQALVPHAEAAGFRIAANPFGQGYVISRPSGGRTVVSDLDGAVDRLGLTPHAAPEVIHAHTSEAAAKALVAVSRARRTSEESGSIILHLEDSSMRLSVSAVGIDVAAALPEDFGDVTSRRPRVSFM